MEQKIYPNHEDEWYVYHNDSSCYVSDCSVLLFLVILIYLLFLYYLFTYFLMHCRCWLSRLWSYGSCIDNYLCNQCLSPLTWARIPPRQGVLDTILCDKACQWLAAGRWFPQGTPVSSTNKTDCHDITKILKVALNTTPYPYFLMHFRW